MSTRILLWSVAMVMTFAGLALTIFGGMVANAQGKPGYQAAHDRPGPAVERIHFRAIPVEEAGHALRAGDIDLYAFGVRPLVAAGLRGQPGLSLYEAPATTLALLLNPAPAKEGSMNPFAIPEVRRAVQGLADREFIVRNIYQGLAKPMWTYVAPFDFDYRIAADVSREKGLRYQPEVARDQIALAMTQAGAVLQDGRWRYRGESVTLRFVIRTEDERRDIGDTVAGLLEEVGFTVERLHRDFGPAINLVHQSNPADLEWHLYTEGWSKVAATRWDYGTANQMAAPWYGNMPGWLEEGFWQYESPQADEAGKRLFRGEFASQEERDALYRQLLEVSVDDSVRAWLAVVMNTYPAGNDLTGITQDIAAGPVNLWTARAAYVPGRDVLRIGNLHVWTAASIWNTVDGFRDLFSAVIWRNLSDPATWTDPGSAQPIPFRSTYQVETAGPGGKLPVPADAFLWDATATEFRPVSSGTQATSKVTVDLSRYIGSRWHHGQPITIADLVFSLYQGPDMALNPKKAEVEASIAARLKPVLETIKGYRLLPDGRLEVYVDYWHFDRDHIGEYAAGFTSTPWELDAAADYLVFTRRSAAYSETAGRRFGVPALSLVLKDHVELMRTALRELRDQRFVPEPLRGSGPVRVTPEEAVARYDAALQWIDEHGLAVISNGPFRLVRFDPAAQFAELEAFRDPTYPLKAADFYYGPLGRIEFTKVDVPDISAGTEGAVLAQLEGPAPLSLHYTLIEGGSDRALQQGEAEAIGEARFRIPLAATFTAGLSPGLYHLHLIAFSERLASPAETTVDFTIGLPPLPAPPVVPLGLAEPGPAWAITGGLAGLVILAAVAAVVLRRQRGQRA